MSINNQLKESIVFTCIVDSSKLLIILLGNLQGMPYKT